MKLKIFIISTVFFSICSFGQITQAEYFWDNDPGQGNGTTMLAFDGNFNQAIESVLVNNASLPSAGNHVLGIRVKGNDGNWGSVFRKVFRVTDNNNSNGLVKITQAEYFWDNDPGQGNGNVMLAFDGNFNQAIESVLVNNAILPSVGNHVIGIRVKGNDGNWGTVFRKLFRVTDNNNSNGLVKITQAEYFWDNDPGQGNGTPMLAFDGNFNQAIESVLHNDATFPAIGNHVIGIRVKGNDGNWGTVFRKVFRVTENNNSNNLVKIIQAEYFWDNDPGQGNGTPMLAFDGNFNQAIESVLHNDATFPAIGNHVIGIRVKGNDGNWGTVFRKVFRVTDNNNSNNLVKITQAEYFWDNDPGQGNGTPMLAFDGNFNQAIESVFHNNATFPNSGLNVLHIRFKADDGNWGVIYSKVVGINISYSEKVTLVSPSNGATSVSTNGSFSWNILTGAGSYEYQCSTDSSFNTLVQTGIVNGFTIPFSSLNPNTLYYWRVRANVNNEVSLWSDIWSFTTNSELKNPNHQVDSIAILYPSPATDYIRLKSSTIESILNFTITSMDGKKILEGKSNIDENIDVQKLPTGNYIFNFSLENGIKSSIKFLKK